jgi:F-type H+-transporting ATPase subunit epsilon
MLQCIVVTPEQTFFDEPAEFVALTLFDGEIGIAPGHSPMIGRLAAGEMRIRHDGRTDRFYVQAGFVEVLGDVVSVLTQRAIRASEIDRPVVEEQLAAALARRAATPEASAARREAIQQVRAQLRVAQRRDQRLGSRD